MTEPNAGEVNNSMYNVRPLEGKRAWEHEIYEMKPPFPLGAGGPSVSWAIWGKKEKRLEPGT